MAFLATVMTNLNIWVHGKKGAKMKELKDFMPIWDKEGQPVKMQTEEEMKMAMMEIARAFKKKPGIQSKKQPPQIKK